MTYSAWLKSAKPRDVPFSQPLMLQMSVRSFVWNGQLNQVCGRVRYSVIPAPRAERFVDRLPRPGVFQFLSICSLQSPDGHVGRVFPQKTSDS
ncbi:hypothetical protein BO83DRAFT_149142 [Aspergillus eucalypticola CBS 122712]|uniref:Uncharacterized protein n=1 Tax=Aspergillus eucalypticola (strain CBS 122712 / IBT 29274) TaxID=1448314 RepID=A0A317UTY9_ASPEC|nr:uncharacterized protein BO83DRAFT_149142 [Aspergillus eucalypticola CBS 122712]PWY63997.1 hypothetical protein BO83DRAFT_149142 [Aspergillus eucalypticola CBS 122712]